LIVTGLTFVQQYGRFPGRRTADRVFRHDVSSRTGKRIAYTGVAYQLSADDLLAAETAAEAELGSLLWRELEEAHR